MVQSYFSAEMAEKIAQNELRLITQLSFGPLDFDNLVSDRDCHLQVPHPQDIEELRNHNFVGQKTETNYKNFFQKQNNVKFTGVITNYSNKTLLLIHHLKGL